MATKQPKKTVKNSSKKVDFYPNRMTFAIAALAAVSLLLFAVLASFR